jgi:hypothetical protein
MKSIRAVVALLLFATVLSNAALAQETLARNKMIGHWFEEHYNVLKSDKNVRQGAFQAQKGAVTLATGAYTNGRPTGEWKYYNMQGKLVQVFDQDNHTLSYNDTTDVRFDGYAFGQDVAPGDAVVPPVKLGGKTLTIFPLMSGASDVLQELYRSNGRNTADYEILHLFKIDPSGRMTDHDIMYVTNGHTKTVAANDKDLPEEHKRFVPATINGKPVSSTVSLKGHLKTLAATDDTL